MARISEDVIEGTERWRARARKKRERRAAGATDGESGAGMPQKEQRAVVKRFRSGEHNVLVATSIGEEGLDIGEVAERACRGGPSREAPPC